MPRSQTPTLVALDLETTGLDPEHDSIIEIGAVKFKGDRVEGEWTTLVNPGRSVSPFITSLTGISDAMLAGAPRLGQVLGDVTDFVGECDIVGHNIGFDLRFLRKKGALRYNDGLDTFDLASVLLPQAGRYSLASLVGTLGVMLPATHRALDDARATFHVYRALVKRARALPLDLLAEITQLGQEVEQWHAGPAFEEAMAARAREKVSPGDRHATTSLFEEPGEKPAGKPLRERPEIRPLDVPALAHLLENGGPFEREFPHFEHRPQQVEMLRRVARAFSDKKHLLVEAGTGTGKSLAYLIPAIHWAMQNGQRVVVSTNTINLQDQLIEKDIPDLHRVLGPDFHAAVLKGRSNYLCPRRFDSLRRHGPRNADEMRLLAKVLVWLGTADGNKRGDKAGLTLTGPGEAAAWSRLSAEDEGCTADRCAEQMEGICPFYRARRASDAAHILIVNHALLLADSALENRVLPEYQMLVIDEGHHLEAATTDGLSFQVTRAELERVLKDLGGTRAGTLGNLLTACRSALPDGLMPPFEGQVEKAYEAASAALDATRTLFEAFATYVRQQHSDDRPSEYTIQLRLLPTHRNELFWMEVETAWQNLRALLGTLDEPLGKLIRGMAEVEDREIAAAEALASDLASTLRRLDEVRTNLDALVSRPDPNMVYWIELPNDNRLGLRAAPLEVGPLVQKHIWNAKNSVVLTSATLTTSGKFDYLRRRLSAEEGLVDEIAVGSPFDYAQSTLLYIVNDIAEPGVRQPYEKAMHSGLIALCRATRGRALVLFTSHAQLRQTANAIRGPLERDDIVVYDQASGASRHQLLEHFRENERAVLLGTKSFWEGVDVPGQALSVLVIAKLPFDVPTDPIVAARSETFENPFYDYSVPEAVLRFRQGFGRLIRTKTDRGVVAVFDRRIISKQYGRIFLNSLPPCTRREGPMAALPAAAAKWIDG